MYSKSCTIQPTSFKTSIDDNEKIVAIRDWLAGLENFPQDFDDLTLLKFLHSCYYDLDKTKKCIEKFCTKRCSMPEVFMDRDPLSPKMQVALSIINTSAFRARDNEFLIYALYDAKLQKYNFYDSLKAFMILADYYLMTAETFPDGHYFIVDMQSITLRMITKVNVFYLRTFVTFLLEAWPVRLKQIHLFNCSSHIDKLYALIKPCLPQNIRDIMKFHLNLESLHSSVEKKYLPIELGGDAGSLKELYLSMVEETQSISFRKMFQDDMMWKTDPKKKNKTQKPLRTDFKNLSID